MVVTKFLILIADLLLLGDLMSSLEYLMMLKRFLIKGRSVIKWSPEHCKVYLPTEYNDLWTELKNRGVVVDVVVFPSLLASTTELARSS